MKRRLTRWDVILGAVWLGTVFAYLATFYFFFDYTSLVRLDPAAFSTLFVLLAGLLAYPIVYWFIETTQLTKYSAEKKVVTPEIEEAKEEVYRELMKLPPASFTILRNLVPDWKFGNIDFVVVGENGVTLVEVKHYAGPVEFKDGKLFQHGVVLKSAVFKWLSKAYKALLRLMRNKIEYVPVRSVIVFTMRSKLILNTEAIPTPNTFITDTERANEVIQKKSGSFLGQPRIRQIVEILKSYCQS